MKNRVILGICGIIFLASCGDKAANLPSPTSNIDTVKEDQLALGSPISQEEIEKAISDPEAYGPAIILTDKGIIKNNAQKNMELKIEQETEKSRGPTLNTLGICDQLWGNTCQINQVWTYRGASNTSQKYYTALINNTSLTQTLTTTATDTNSSNVSGGFDQGPIRLDIGYNYSSSLSTQVTANVRANSRVSVYTFQTGEGGYGTQYQYPLQNSSCFSAGVECKQSNFSAFSARSLGYRLQ